MMSCQTKETWVKLAGGWQLLLRDWLGIGQRVVNSCIVHHLFCELFYYDYYFSLFCPIKLSDSLSQWRGVSERLCDV